ncbi:calcyclin binding protein, putative [Plasmodium sp. gorilla clade G2]|uniref:calcyclin binding protein, putative n=1 Tax=Plasmodium sp. gorilla clade G2 TaxID=880535 RepID=UPI000D20D8A0|nr:calcyclin binding protein, putative [Plasmodium sp. gorilla clade G2]SOV14505.1 calcyclin binding protein, putative [Plasmodium sp. gorilla clade G2]
MFKKVELDFINKLKNEKKVVDEKVIRYDWSQTHNNLFFTLYKKEVEEKNFFYYIKNDYMSLIICINDDEIYHLEKYLFSNIITEQTKINLTQMKIEIILEKEIKGVPWDNLTKTNNDECDEKNSKVVNPFAGKSLIKEDKDESVDYFFKKIYNEGDDDTKRAMIKSFQTSGGKVLSTNWKDVKNKQYEQDI